MLFARARYAGKPPWLTSWAISFLHIAAGLSDFPVLGGIRDYGRIGHLLSNFLVALFQLLELLGELHESVDCRCWSGPKLGDYEFAALLFFERHGAFQRVYGD